MYGCETWLLDSGCLQKLEKFQHELGRRILRLPKFYSGDAVRIGLHWPSMATRILTRKLLFLSKLLSTQHAKAIISRVFTSLAIDNIYDTSIIQQCRMLESHTRTDCIGTCLSNLDTVSETAKHLVKDLLKEDYNNLIADQTTHTSTKLIVCVANDTSWNRLWDLALDKGPKGTKIMQLLFRVLSKPHATTNFCIKCDHSVEKTVNLFQHAINVHPEVIGINNFRQDILENLNSCDCLFEKLTLLYQFESLWACSRE